MGVLIPILRGYITFPLYALVTQMGTSMGNSVFPEEVMVRLRRWRAKAKKNMATTRGHLAAHSLDASVESSPSFATLSVDLDYRNDDEDGIESDERLDEENARQSQRKIGSFEGFEISRV